jgi:DNA-binding NtrC family response regulator
VTTTARTILIVGPTISLANSLSQWLRHAGYDLAIVTTFADAKAHLRTSPDLVVTEVRLGEYNGLHLALYAQAEGIPAIVIGASDAVVEEDARQFGASFLHADEISKEQVVPLVAQLLSQVEERRSKRSDVDGQILPPGRSAIASDMSAGSGVASEVCAGVVSDVEWVVAPEVVRTRVSNHTRRLTLH